MTKLEPWYPLFAFLAGVITVFGFAPFNVYPITVLTLAAFFALILQAKSLKQHWFITWAFSFGLLMTGVHWVYYSIHFFNHAPWIFAAIATFLFALFISLFMLPFALLTQFFRHRHPALLLLLVFPAAWVLAEGFRGWALTGFPWLLLGQAQIDNWLAHFSPIAGVYGVSWLVALLAGGLVLLVRGQQQQKMLAIATLASVIISSALLSTIDWTKPSGDPLRVSLLQGNIPQEKKWQPDYYQPTIDRYKRLTDQSWDSDIIIWPETAIPGYFTNASEDLIEPLRVQALMENTSLMIGGFYHDHTTDMTYNSILSLDGDNADVYSKSHLVPFSEYFPFLDYLRWMEKWVQLPYDSVGRGSGHNTTSIQGITAQLGICYEDVYGNEVIRGLPQANMLINLSNDGWFTGSIEPMQHMQIARMRALETGRYMLRATNNGVSGIIDQKGRIIATAPQYEESIITADAIPYEGSTPYIHWGNLFIFGLMAGLLLTLIFLVALRKL